MTDDQVYVIDRVITRPGCAKTFVDAYLSGYAPGARGRGMTLQRVLVSPPIWCADQTNTVTIIWSLQSPQAWWEMRWQGRSDPSIGQWWAGIADLVVERTRSVAADAENVDGMCDV
ncbi:hypothetical protein [Mycobacterium shimoidei]|uniref:hypothetical protein n=1 Tax=Mycobacterium shimoidei TaxID=29313 RepID=UPI000848766F|nr:hypothetical protein [Mycobacterium shimoidei]MCV7259371.1 hypothetical protein [Mycobacterium shimoidei]ODR14750.1 hypothetical protein BHQ16_04765 [Mycobacterium shimoidei]ORW81114.1 hypothetical protein AWC26_09665 [Mycobacterium shimoidei]